MNVDLERTRRVFQKLMRVAPCLENLNTSARSVSAGYLPLQCEVLETGRDFRRIALGQYWVCPSGDLIPDPDIEIAVFLDWELAEATTYRDAFRYDEAYPVMGEPPDFEVHGHINGVLETWLDALAEQGHLLSPCHRQSQNRHLASE
ncbi:MAG: DUF1249 domain-containing protein [Tepidimonas sp.]|nr:DUF1249 domain-containing protein [Tepidimonas sp.]